MNLIDEFSSRTWEEWVVGSALTYTGTKAIQKYGWRRPLRSAWAGAKGTGRFARASALTMNDFYRAQSNAPFAWEPAFAPTVALTLYALTPVAMVGAAVAFPHVASAQQQSAATGQPSIGSAGHRLIYG
ncbi:MAG: type IV secretory pathway, VirD4 component [Circular genetic element sp.]|nr:MAG: type IV secretory pathway, VirD4 component [Circular genetic element sp.]